MGTESIEDVYPYPGVAAAFGAADDLGKDKPKPPDDDAPEEGRGRVVDTGVHQASMRRWRGEAKLAIDETRLVILRAEKENIKTKGEHVIPDNRNFKNQTKRHGRKLVKAARRHSIFILLKEAVTEGSCVAKLCDSSYAWYIAGLDS